MISKSMVIGLIQMYAPAADPDVIAQAVDDYMDEHPEITVEDGSITEEKLAADVVETLTSLKSAIQQKYTKPDTGIPASDLASGAIPSIPSIATSAQIKTGTDNEHPIAPSVQHESAFYGLAKAAGNTDQSESSNAVGVYTADAQLKIQKMLGLWTPKIYIKYTTDEEVQTIIDANFPFNDIEINIYEELVICIYQSDTSQTAYASNDWVYFTIRDAINAAYINVSSMYLKGTKQCSIMRIKRLPYAIVAELIDDGNSIVVKAFPRSLDYVDKIRWISTSCSGGTFKAGTTIETYISRFY